VSLAGVVKSGVRTVQRVTGSLQEQVTHRAWIGQDGFGAESWGEPVGRLALVEQRVHMRRLSDGRLVEVRAKLTLLEEVEPNGAPDRIEPVDLRDRFTLADGTTGPVLDVQGLRNPEDGQPYLLEVYLGSSGVGTL
jgi:hypothetical protein